MMATDGLPVVVGELKTNLAAWTRPLEQFLHRQPGSAVAASDIPIERLAAVGLDRDSVGVPNVASVELHWSAVVVDTEWRLNAVRFVRGSLLCSVIGVLMAAEALDGMAALLDIYELVRRATGAPLVHGDLHSRQIIVDMAVQPHRWTLLDFGQARIGTAQRQTNSSDRSPTASSTDELVGLFKDRFCLVLPAKNFFRRNVLAQINKFHHTSSRQVP
eukprot:m51a1_g11854 hypothetical protein (217) ;mRNA; f:495651-496457